MTSTACIGPCIVCTRVRELRGAGCAECLARFGARFVELAVRIRQDDDFRRLCRRALPEELRRAFDRYFLTESGKGHALAVPVRLDTLSDRALRRTAGARSIIKGIELVEFGAVELISAHAGAIAGIVCGPEQETHRVELSLTDDTEAISTCTCQTGIWSANPSQPHWCRHASAVLVLARQRAREVARDLSQSGKLDSR